MPKIGTLANAASATFDLSYLPQFFQVGAPDLANTMSSLSITGRGKNIIQLSNAAQIQALIQLENGVMAVGATTTLGGRLMISEGRIEGQSTITAVNSAPTTPDAFASSLGKAANILARSVAVTPVVASGNNSFKGFDVIYFLPANVDRVEVTYANGFTEPLEVEELQANYLADNNSTASGLVNGFVVVQGARAASQLQVVSCRVYATSGGNVDVVVCGWQQL